MAFPRKDELVVEVVHYDDKTYRRYPESKHPHLRRYFWRSGGGGHSLHRAVWEHHNGPVPEGWHVHHIDRDVDNNDISNLECLPSKKHHLEHSEERSARGREKRQLEHLEKIREKASEWHRSEQGRQWHREVSAKHLAPGGATHKGRRQWLEERKANPITRTCTECGTDFPSPTGRASICSQTCACRKSRRKRREKARLQSDGS